MKTYVLPAPPPLSALTVNVRGVGRVGTTAAKMFRAKALEAIRDQGVTKHVGNVIVIYGVERGSKASDIDNTSKAILDVLQAAGVIENDNKVLGLAMSWLPKTKDRRAIVKIMPVSRREVTFQPSQDGEAGAWMAWIKETD